MRITLRVFNKALIKQFYKENTGFFLVVIGLGFGFLKVNQHLEIAAVLASKPLFYLIPFGLWIFYSLKTYLFILEKNRLKENYWFSYLILAGKTERRLISIALQAQLLALPLLYSVFLASIAFQLKQWNAFLIWTLPNLCLWLVSSYFLDKALTKPIDQKNVKIVAKNFAFGLPKKLSTLFIHHLLNQKSLLLLGTKLISIVVIFGAILIYNMEKSDLRILSLGLLLSAGINTSFSFLYFRFNQNQLALFRNLPISKTQYFVALIFNYALLLIPEYFFLFSNVGFRENSLFLVASLIFPLALLVFFQKLLDLFKLKIEAFARLIFLLIAALFFVILGHIDTFILGISLLVLAFIASQKQTHN